MEIFACVTDFDCNDNNVCNGDEICQGGICTAGTPLNCDDGNVCTDESCSAQTGCQNINNSSACDDSNACTSGDTCSGGICQGGPPISCNDGNICTDDSCIPASGCAFTNNTAACNDSSSCTENDHCSKGICNGTPITCDDGDNCTVNSCIAATGCVYTPIPGCECDENIDCNDNNPCTDDTCTAGTCNNANNTAPCNDGLYCTANDICANGICTGSGSPCNSSQSCNESTDTCVTPGGGSGGGGRGECTNNADCPANKVCVDHTCKAQYTLTIDLPGADSPAYVEALYKGNKVILYDGYQHSYLEGAAVQLTAVVYPITLTNQMPVFAGWAGDLDGFDNPDTIIMDENKTVLFKSIMASSPDWNITMANCVDPYALPVTMTLNMPNVMPYGLINLAMAADTVTMTASFNVGLPEPAPAVAKWYKCSKSTSCIDFSRDVISGGTGDGAEFNADRTVVTVYLTDNGPYDDNDTAGVILDPSGLGMECLDQSDCSDGQFCNGIETCDEGECISGTAPCTVPQTCNEAGDTCSSPSIPRSGGGGGGGGSTPLPPPVPECLETSDCDNGRYCDPKTSTCVECLQTSHCDDSLFCNGIEFCYNNDCVAGTPPCDQNETCHEILDKCLPQPECTANAECDDGVFCNGQERCNAYVGICEQDDPPCSSMQICVEALGECWDLRKLTAQSLQNIILRPFFLAQRCPWLILRVADDNHFDQSSSIMLIGPSDDATGVLVDKNRTAIKFWQFILIPICIDKDSTVGLWRVSIETDVQDPAGSFKESIEASFEIR